MDRTNNFETATSENLHRGYPSRTERLPEAVEAIDAAWLTRTLRNRFPGLSVDRMERVQLIPGHTTKIRVAVKLSGHGSENLPSRLCLKGNWTGDPLSGPANVNEARFYRDLSDGVPLPAPPCVYADWDDDEEGHQGVMVLEDIEPWGGTFGNSSVPISAEAVGRGLEALAQLHRTTWNDPRLDSTPWLLTAMAPDNPVDDYWTLMGNYVNQMNRRTEQLSVLPRWIAEDPLRLRQAWLQLAARERADLSPYCLVHGDAHLGNSYALPDGRRLFFDWQIVRKGRPWRDYTYWVVGSMPIDERRRFETDLLHRYLSLMAEAGIQIPFDQAWDDYRRWLVWGLVAWHLNANPNEDTVSTLSRFGAAAKDHKLEQFFRL